MQSINGMRRSAQGKNVEIVNFHYARFVYDPNELKQYNEIGVDLIQDFIDSIKCDKIKERIGVDFSLQKTGNDENVILVTGIGALYESLPDEFFELLDLPAFLKANVEAKMKEKVAPPRVMKRASDILEDEGKVEKPKKVKIDTEKPAPAVTKITKPKKVIKEATGEKATDGAEYIKAYMDAENYAERPDLIKKLMTEKGMKKSEAEAAVEEMIRVYADIKHDGDMIYKD